MRATKFSCWWRQGDSSKKTKHNKGKTKEKQTKKTLQGVRDLKDKGKDQKHFPHISPPSQLLREWLARPQKRSNQAGTSIKEREEGDATYLSQRLWPPARPDYRRFSLGRNHNGQRVWWQEQWRSSSSPWRLRHPPSSHRTPGNWELTWLFPRPPPTAGRAGCKYADSSWEQRRTQLSVKG